MFDFIFSDQSDIQEIYQTGKALKSRRSLSQESRSAVSHTSIYSIPAGMEF